MAARTRPDDKQVVARLAAIRSNIAQMAGMMPRAAAELRRTLCEDIEDLMKELA